jgi:hypothetical protein
LPQNEESNSSRETLEEMLVEERYFAFTDKEGFAKKVANYDNTITTSDDELMKEISQYISLKKKYYPKFFCFL